MDARIFRAAILAGALVSAGASHRTPNFVVNAPTAEIAKQIGDAAEKYRRELAVEWTGREMPNWAQPCPLTVQIGPHLGAGGATSFVFDHGEVFGWQMNIQGPLDRVLDSVLPHEITHTVFACHFRQPLPRWADEGACGTVEHPEERGKQQQMLLQFLRTGRGIPFSQMFAMREYPRDVLPLYAQGHSLASFLLDQGGKQKYLNFVSDGLHSERWSDVVREHYGFRNLGHLQNAWLDWVSRGSPSQPQQDVASLAANTKQTATPEPVVRGQSEDPPLDLTSPLVPVTRPHGGANQPSADVAVLPGPIAPAASGWHAAAPRPGADLAAARTSPSGTVVQQWGQPQAAAPAASDPPRSVYDARVPSDTMLR